MKLDDIENARKEAECFVIQARNVLDEARQNRFVLLNGTKETGALRRQSMELTRALAAMRNPK